MSAAFVCWWMVHWSLYRGGVTSCCCRHPLSMHVCTLKMFAQPNQYTATEGHQKFHKISLNLHSLLLVLLDQKSRITKHPVVILIKMMKRHQVNPFNLLQSVHQLDANYMSTYANIYHLLRVWWLFIMFSITFFGASLFQKKMIWCNVLQYLAIQAAIKSLNVKLT